MIGPPSSVPPTGGADTWHLRAAPPNFFGRPIVKLLLNVGFGGSAADAGRAIGGDDGVDGVIDQDAFGLDRAYIQAKRYASGSNTRSVAIRDFFESLDRHLFPICERNCRVS